MNRGHNYGYGEVYIDIALYKIKRNKYLNYSVMEIWHMQSSAKRHIRTRL